MAKVAFIGLGVMGYPMAAHLKNKGGHAVTVYNRTAGKAEKWVAEHGGEHAPTPAEAAREKDFVFSCVGNDDDLRGDDRQGRRLWHHEEGRDLHRQYDGLGRGGARTGSRSRSRRL